MHKKSFYRAEPFFCLTYESPALARFSNQCNLTGSLRKPHNFLIIILYIIPQIRQFVHI